MNLTDAATLRRFLTQHNLAANKGLGQHFLCSGPVVSKIVASLAGCRGLLEIGPGPGVLTSPLSEVAEKMIAIELDERMVAALSHSAPRADARKLDALKADLPAILEELPSPRGLVSNLPYYITGPLLTRIAEARASFDVAVLMMQKEVAQRVMAGPRDSLRGSLSVFLQLQFEIRKVADAPAGAFLPPPKVDSTVLEFRPRPLPETSAPSPTGPQGTAAKEGDVDLFRLVRLGFAQPRKTLVNNLLAGFRLDRESAAGWVARAGLGERARPQELSLEEWIRLAASAPA